jgi:sec-independent protein translocase protein TatA
MFLQQMPEVSNMIGGKIGIWELLIVLAVALIIFGPAKLPELGRSIGRGIREFRQASKDIGQSISLDDAPEETEGKKG